MDQNCRCTSVSMGLSRRKPGRRGIVVAALLALGIQLGSFWVICVLSGNVIQESERQTAAVAARSSALRVQLQKLTFGILSADAAASNFLLSGSANALMPFRRANDAAPDIIGIIQRLCDGHVDELDRIHRISSLSDAAFDRLSDLRQYAPDGKPPTRPPENELASAHKAVQSLVTEVAAFQESESRGLAQSLKSIGHSATVSQQNLTDLGGSLAIGGGILSTVILVAVVLRRERRLIAALECARLECSREEPVATTRATPRATAAAPVALAPPPSHPAPTAREVVEQAVLQVHEAASARLISFRAEIGPAWDFTVGGDPKSLQQAIAGVFGAMIDSGAPGGPVTLSCLEQPGRMVRLQFHCFGTLIASKLPETLLNHVLSQPGCSLRGGEAGVIWLEFPCVPNISDLAALQQAAQSTIRVASPA